MWQGLKVFVAGGEWHVSSCHRQQMLRRVRGEGGEMRLATLEYSEYKLWAYLDSIAVSIFVDILVELTISETVATTPPTVNFQRATNRKPVIQVNKS